MHCRRACLCLSVRRPRGSRCCCCLAIAPGRVRAGDAAFSRVEKVVRPSPLRPLRPSRLPPWSMYPRLARGHTRLPARPRRVTQNSELLAITYGALVAQLVEDYEDPAAINEQLEKMCDPPEPPEPREPRAASREPRTTPPFVHRHNPRRASRRAPRDSRQGLQHRHENHRGVPGEDCGAAAVVEDTVRRLPRGDGRRRQGAPPQVAIWRWICAWPVSASREARE